MALVLRLGVFLVAIVVGSEAPLSGQNTAQTVAAAQEARAAGDAGRALTIVDAILARRPTDVPAVRLKIEMLAAQSESNLALAAYDRYVVAGGAADRTLLAVVAASDLRRIAAGPDADSSREALARLARAGDTDARRTLIARFNPAQVRSIDSLTTVTTLARLGIPGAEASLGDLVGRVLLDDRYRVLQAIGAVGARSQAVKVAALLSDADPRIRVSAAQALIALGVRDTLPAVRTAYAREAEPAAKLFMGLALKSAGGSEADADVARMFASDVGEVRMHAARAYYAAGSTQWIPRIRALSADRDESVRVQAADLLACCDRPAATSILRTAIASPNPLLRFEAAQVIERHSLADTAMLRQLLGDPEAAVRQSGAGATLAPPPSTPTPATR